jgi:ceramide glucosyltransferase
MDFMPAALAARFLEGRVYFGLGSTMAVSREAVQAIGGLETLADYLADDYELATRIADAGYEVVLSKTVVETYVPDYAFQDFFHHQLRWGRTVRSSRPKEYFGVVLTFGVFWALAAIVLSQAAWWSWVILAVAVGLRMVIAQLIGVGTIADNGVWRRMWLLPLRELISAMVWFMSLSGGKIVWRGEVFDLSNGKLSRRTKRKSMPG